LVFKMFLIKKTLEKWDTPRVIILAFAHRVKPCLSTAFRLGNESCGHRTKCVGSTVCPITTTPG
jgi:hypothetical protein